MKFSIQSVCILIVYLPIPTSVGYYNAWHIKWYYHWQFPLPLRYHPPRTICINLWYLHFCMMKAKLLWTTTAIRIVVEYIDSIYSIQIYDACRNRGRESGLNYLPDLSPLSFTMELDEWIMTAKISWGFFKVLWNLWFLFRTVFRPLPLPLLQLHHSICLGAVSNWKAVEKKFPMTWLIDMGGVLGIVWRCGLSDNSVDLKLKFTIDTRWNLSNLCDKLSKREREWNRERGVQTQSPVEFAKRRGDDA